MSETPEFLGKYQIRREIGRGAMGIVYEGWDPAIGRRVALKTIRGDTLDKREATEMLDRFRREAQAAGRLNHPNTVSVYEYGEQDGVAFIAMEFIDGRELKECFDNGERFTLDDIVRLMGEILAALESAHNQGIVHRDVKPANIFILPDGRAKVADFGIARIESSNLTQVGSVLGTPAYMSPEQLTGQIADRRSDIFSAGVILYQFLAGEKPFCGNFAAILHKVLHENPVPPSQLNVHVPPAFDAIVAKALARSPDQRFPTAIAFATALQQTHRAPAAPDPDATAIDLPSPAVALPATPAAPAPTAPAVAASGHPQLELAARPWLVPALATALGATVIAAVFFALRPPRPAIEAPAQAPVVASQPAPAQPAATSTAPPATLPTAGAPLPGPVLQATAPIPARPKPEARPAVAEKRPPPDRERRPVVTSADCPSCNCPDLMLKMSMGVEGLTAAQRAFFSQNCR